MIPRRGRGGGLRPGESKLQEVSAKPRPGTINLQLTWEFCPEQYEAFLDGKLVGYLRLRAGTFIVEFPSAAGETIYEASPRGQGCFEEDERDHYLRLAIDAIYNRVFSENSQPLNFEAEADVAEDTKLK